MLNSFEYFLPVDIENEVMREIRTWRSQDKINRLWKKDATLWTGSDEARWLGWLDVGERELANLNKYEQFSSRARVFESIVLLGMGGSSLCPEVLAKTFQRRKFFVLDSTVPAQIYSLEKKINLDDTLFIVASKSGTTLEPNCLKQYFFEKICGRVGREKAGRQFVAITDPGSRLYDTARTDGFLDIFLGDPQVGGRFSALSTFGIAPATAMQISIEEFLRNSLLMQNACKALDPAENPGALLGIILGVCWRNKKDKLTIFCSPEISSFGAWLEQLIAESTGKNGKAIIPVDKESMLPDFSDYDDDRVFVHIKLKSSTSLESESFSAFGHPFLRIEVEDEMHLGQEFFRWEFATAVAGAIMNVNPFDQPDVESAKIATRDLMRDYEDKGVMPIEDYFFETSELRLNAGYNYKASLGRFVGEEKSVEKFLHAHISHIQKGDYFAILAYLEMNEENESLLQQIRDRVLHRELCATCLGFGPRFLHSTGQAYKGGPNTGVFLQITSDDQMDLSIPNQKYSFGIVKAAQAAGDFRVLVQKNRRALHIHIKNDVAEGLRVILQSLESL